MTRERGSDGTGSLFQIRCVSMSGLYGLLLTVGFPTPARL